jgi:redox-sensitive bicupin YhaK (pirin superfamily)
MTAGRGIIHSEMPQQLEGRMRGFQLWINLPAKEKMKPAGYRDVDPAEIPAVALPKGGRVKVIAGAVEVDGKRTRGPVEPGATEPLYLDVELPAGGEFSQAVPAGHNAFVYPYEGSITIGEGEGAKALEARSAGLLSEGDRIVIAGGAQGARFLVLAGKPLREPVVQYGPFVMNTREEIEQAINDYQNGELAAVR